MLNVLALYKCVPPPWGGANNFLYSLYRELESRNLCRITHDPRGDFDVVFMCQLGKGPGHSLTETDDWHYSPEEISRLKEENPAARLVVRAVNLRSHSHGRGFLGNFFNFKDRKKDRNVLKLLSLADHVIYQSAYQKEFFEENSAPAIPSTVIHNGAGRDISDHLISPLHYSPGDRLKIFSYAFSARATKRHDMIASISRNKDTDVVYAGRWPDGVNPHNVKLLGILDHTQILEHYKNSHYFLHPSIMDPCPNSIIESMSLGIPVIYNPGKGSSGEIVRDMGVPITDKTIDESIFAARRQHHEILQKLKLNKEEFSIGAAAQKYHDVFRGALDS